MTHLTIQEVYSIKDRFLLWRLLRHIVYLTETVKLKKIIGSEKLHVVRNRDKVYRIFNNMNNDHCYK